MTPRTPAVIRQRYYRLKKRNFEDGEKDEKERDAAREKERDKEKENEKEKGKEFTPSKEKEKERERVGSPLPMIFQGNDKDHPPPLSRGTKRKSDANEDLEEPLSKKPRQGTLEAFKLPKEPLPLDELSLSVPSLASENFKIQELNKVHEEEKQRLSKELAELKEKLAQGERLVASKETKFQEQEARIHSIDNLNKDYRQRAKKTIVDLARAQGEVPCLFFSLLSALMSFHF